MNFYPACWPAFYAVLSANLIAAAVIYAGLLRYQGQTTGAAMSESVRMVVAVLKAGILLGISAAILGFVAFCVISWLYGSMSWYITIPPLP